MKQFQYDFSVKEQNAAEADKKMQALTTLAARLTTKELCKLAHIVEHDPAQTAMAKKFLGV